MKIYRLAAVAISAILLLALVTVLLMSAEHASTDATTTTAAITTTTAAIDSRNDGVVSEPERESFGRAYTLDRLNQLARLICAAAASGLDRQTIVGRVHDRMLEVRPSVTPAAAATLVNRIVGVTCADAFAALP